MLSLLKEHMSTSLIQQSIPNLLQQDLQTPIMKETKESLCTWAT